MNKEFWRCALIRAARTFCQSLSSNIPIGMVITPVMIETLDISFLYCILAWLATGLLGAVLSILTSIATGLPEVDHES